MTKRSRMKRRKANVVCVLTLSTLLTAPGAGHLLAEQSDRAHQVGAKLKCMCGGCDQSAARCMRPRPAQRGAQ
jgi:hypothetical protein